MWRPKGRRYIHRPWDGWARLSEAPRVETRGFPIELVRGKALLPPEKSELDPPLGRQAKLPRKLRVLTLGSVFVFSKIRLTRFLST
jgi:hypothetical protein